MTRPMLSSMKRLAITVSDHCEATASMGRHSVKYSTTKLCAALGLTSKVCARHRTHQALHLASRRRQRRVTLLRAIPIMRVRMARPGL